MCADLHLSQKTGHLTTIHFLSLGHVWVRPASVTCLTRKGDTQNFIWPLLSLGVHPLVLTLSHTSQSRGKDNSSSIYSPFSFSIFWQMFSDPVGLLWAPGLCFLASGPVWMLYAFSGLAFVNQIPLFFNSNVCFDPESTSYFLLVMTTILSEKKCSSRLRNLDDTDP